MREVIAALCLFAVTASAPPARAQTRSATPERSVPSIPSKQDQAPQLGQQQEVSAEETLTVSTTLVNIPLRVVDRQGRNVTALRKEDFRVFEDGVEHGIAFFEHVDVPFTVVLLLDTSGSTFMRLDDIQAAAIRFLDQLRPADQVMVVSFDEKVKTLTEATKDRAVLREAIRRTRNGAGTRLYDAVDLTINKHLRHVTSRKAIILFGDGVDTRSRCRADETIRAVEELDAVVYPVQYDTAEDLQRFKDEMKQRGTPVEVIGSDPADFVRADAYLNALAEKTGGSLYRADGVARVAEALTAIAEQLRRQYRVGYYPRDPTRPGERRQIKVQVNRPDLTIRARDSYVAGQRRNNQKLTASERVGP